jgi:hypothetical protein
MSTRLERVVLELDDRFSREMLKPAASVRLFREELKGLDRDSVSFSRTTSVFERDSARVGASIDRFSGRLALIAQSAGALGPALVPITTALVPAIAGLTTELGFGIAAVGVGVLAFQGFGDTLDALNKAQLKPTAENIAKLREEASHLSPAARELVIQIDKMGPAFREVRDAAQEGLLPGVSDSLDEIETLLPRLSSIVGEIGDVTGELLASGSESLAGPEWANFFTFIEAEARPTLTALGKTVGHLTKGLAEMWMAFDPLSDDFVGGLREASETFESWSEGLSDSDDFRAFVEYIRETGPQVLETLGDVGNMFLQVAEAAAPLGGPTLEILGALADIIAGVADSDLGTPIMTGVAALSAMNLVMSLTGKIGTTAFGGIVKGQAQATLGLRGVRAELALLRAEYLRTGNTATLTKLSDAAERNRKGLAAVGKGAGLAVGGLALMETGLVETKTATFLLTGAMVGGVHGAVAGGLIGAVADVVSVSKQADRAIGSLDRTLDGFDLTKSQEGLARFGEEIESVEDKAGNLERAATFIPVAGTYIAAGLDKYFDDKAEELGRTKEEVKSGLQSIVGTIGQAFGEDITPIWAEGTIAAEDWSRVVARATPALAALGITVDELLDMDPVELEHAAGLIRDWTLYADSAEGRTDAFAAAIAGLSDEAETATTRAEALSDAMDALFNPKMDLAAARNDWKQALQGLAADLDTKIIPGHSVKDGPDVPDREVAGSRSLFDDSEGALQNQDVIFAKVEKLKNLIDKLAVEHPEKVAAAFKAERDGLVESAVQAGLSRKEVEKYLKVLGFTEKTWKAVIDAAGIEAAERKADRLNRKLDHAMRERTIKLNVETGNVIRSGDRFGVSVQDRNGNGIPDYLESADGGTVAKTGLGYADRHPYLLADGEEVISNRFGQADRNRSLLKAINAGRLADGGTVARSVPMPSFGGGVDYDRLTQAVLAARPLYGDIYQQPHNYSEFKREMDADRAMSMSDGVRRR